MNASLRNGLLCQRKTQLLFLDVVMQTVRPEPAQRGLSSLKLKRPAAWLIQLTAHCAHLNVFGPAEAGANRMNVTSKKYSDTATFGAKVPLSNTAGAEKPKYVALRAPYYALKCTVIPDSHPTPEQPKTYCAHTLTIHQTDVLKSRCPCGLIFRRAKRKMSRSANQCAGKIWCRCQCSEWPGWLKFTHLILHY